MQDAKVANSNLQKDDLNNLEAKSNAHIAFFLQLAALLYGGMFINTGDYFFGAMGFLIGVFVCVGHALVVWTKINPSRLMLYFLGGAPLMLCSSAALMTLVGK